MKLSLIIAALIITSCFAGRLTTDSYGIIHDSATGLEWFVGPDVDTSWYAAVEWIDDLELDGGGWRLPTADEARSLFDAGIGRREAPEIGISSWWVWISGTCSSEQMARNFSFYDGIDCTDYKDVFNAERALAVR